MRYLKIMLYINCFYIMGTATNGTMINGIFRAGGDTRTGCLIEMGTLYLAGIPAVAAAGLWLHLPFLWIVVIMFGVEDILKGTVCLIHFLRRKWIIRLTDDNV